MKLFMWCGVGVVFRLQIIINITMQRQRDRGERKAGVVVPKPIVSMLSQLKIEIPKPLSARKISFTTSKHNNLKSPSSKGTQHQGLNPYLQPTNLGNSREDYAAALHRLETGQSDLKGQASSKEKEIIMQWVKTLFQKRNLLGVHWEHKIRMKRKDMLRQSFNCMKEGKESCHSFLKTQSKHRPHPQRFNQLVVIGLEKMVECFERCSAKRKRQAFVYTLRFLAFKRSGNSYGNGSLSGWNKKDIIDSPNKVIANKLPSQQNNNPKKQLQPILRQEKSPQNEDYSIFAHSQQILSLKKAKSSNFIPLVQNQYALTPKSPAAKPFKQQKLFVREDLNPQVAMSKLSRNSDRSRIQGQLIQSKSQPHVAIGGIGGNFKYEFNQHNYILVQPQNMQYAYSAQSIKEGPPSPMLHQQGMRLEQSNRQHINFPLGFSPQPRESSRMEVKRDLNYTRPHSHNPFNPIQPPTNLQKPLQQPEPRKSRAVSVSANIKISFKSRDDSKPEQTPIPNEYQMGKQIPTQMVQKLASPQSKRLRQSYQMNNFNHDLFPKEYIQSPQTPRGNFVHYTNPSSPRPEDHKSLSIKFLNPAEPNQSNPISPRTPRGICYKSFLPSSPVEKVQMKRSVQIAPETARRSTRQKLFVTSAMGLRST